MSNCFKKANALSISSCLKSFGLCASIPKTYFTLYSFESLKNSLLRYDLLYLIPKIFISSGDSFFHKSQRLFLLLLYNFHPIFSRSTRNDLDVLNKKICVIPILLLHHRHILIHLHNMA